MTKENRFLGFVWVVLAVGGVGGFVSFHYVLWHGLGWWALLPLLPSLLVAALAGLVFHGAALRLSLYILAIACLAPSLPAALVAAIACVFDPALVVKAFPDVRSSLVLVADYWSLAPPTVLRVGGVLLAMISALALGLALSMWRGVWQAGERIEWERA
jgi:hypothetical protein